MENNKPTLEEYISEQIKNKRLQALDKSRNRTEILVPIIPNPQSKDEWEQQLLNTYNDYIKASYEHDRLGNNTQAQWCRQQAQRYKNNYLKGYQSTITGANCMYNAGDCYGLKIPGTQTFKARHKQLGFIKGKEMKPGDIVLDIKYDIPTHAMIYDHTFNGIPLFNYARGSINKNFQDSYVKQGKYKSDKNEVYKYVGTPADSAKWIDQYFQLYK